MEIQASQGDPSIAVAEIFGPGDVRSDGIAENDIVAGKHLDRRAAVCGDDIATADTTNQIVASLGHPHAYAGAMIWHRLCAGDICANEVRLDHIAGSENINAVTAVDTVIARNQIADDRVVPSENKAGPPRLPSKLAPVRSVPMRFRLSASIPARALPAITFPLIQFSTA